MSIDFNIKEFDSYREDNRLEVKRAKDRLPDSLWETYSAFANTNGGCIILGVKERDDGSFYTTGLKDASKLKKEFWDLIHNPSKVNIGLLSDKDVRDYEKDGDVILVIKVPRATREDKPVYINGDMWGQTFRRDWEGDYHCTRSSILAMLRDQTDETPDMKVLENKEIKDFDQNSVKSYRTRYNATHQGHPWCDLNDDEFLMMIGAASDETEDGRIHPTAAGLLMFGMYHRIMREFPEYFLDYRERLDPSIRWTDRVASNSGDWSGNVFDFFTKVSFKLTADLKKPFKTEGIYRIDDTPVHVAVREALANCLVNADYFLPWNVVIDKYPEKIIMANPGTIRTGKRQMLRGGISQPRNRIMLNMFNFIGIGERAGSGVPDIFNIWKLENYPEPIIEELSGREGSPDRTILTLPLVASDKITKFLKNDNMAEAEKVPKKSAEKKVPKKSAEKKLPKKTAEQRAIICDSMKSGEWFKASEIGETLDIGERRLRVLLKSMVEDGEVIEEGKTKGKKYRLSPR